MRLIVGLGNPEDKYTNTRHNVGFRTLDAFAQAHDLSFHGNNKFHAQLAELVTNTDSILLVKPTTYYNDVGRSVRALADFYRITPDNILIIHDELALPFGTIRTRRGGSNAGNNGIKSINDCIGPETARIRIGIYNDLRDRIDDADFVLGQWTATEAEELQTILATATTIVDDFIAGRFEHTSHR